MIKLQTIHEFMADYGLSRDQIPLLYDKLVNVVSMWPTVKSEQEKRIEEVLQFDKRHVHRILIPIVCRAYGINDNEIKKRTRAKPFPEARFVIYKILSHDYKYPLTRIGKIFNRDHSTVIHGIKVFYNIYQTDEQFREFYFQIVRRFNNKMITLQDEQIKLECQVKTLLSLPDTLEEMPKPMQMDELRSSVLQQLNELSRAKSGKIKLPG